MGRRGSTFVSLGLPIEWDKAWSDDREPAFPNIVSLVIFDEAAFFPPPSNSSGGGPEEILFTARALTYV